MNREELEKCRSATSCSVATGATIEEVESELREAIAFHIEGMREDGLSIPDPTSQVEYIEFAA